MKKVAKKPGEAESVPATIPKPRLFGNWTGKLPVNILSEHIQREKWDKPNYRFKSVAKGHLCWIKLKRRNNKTGGWDEVEFTSFDSYPSEQLAKHSTATYVLHRLLSDRNIHSILPPLMRELWYKYDKEKKEMDPDIVHLHYTSNPFEVNQVEKEDKTNQKKEPFEDYPSIHIPKDSRERLEALLRSNLEHVVFDKKEPDLHIVNQNLEKILIGKGFRMAHAREALQYCKNLNEAISWLCIHCPEDDLPKDMKPTDNKSIVFSNLSIDDLKVSLSLERLMSTGASRTQCLKHLKMKEGDEYLAAGSLCLELAGVTELDVADSVETFETAVTDEIEALQSIFSDNLTVNTSPTGWALSFDVESAGKLDIVISNASKYPNELPGVTLVEKNLPAYIKLAILQKVVRETVLHIGSPMIYTIVDFVKLYTPIILDRPPPLLSLYQIAHPITFGSTTPALREKKFFKKIESSRTNSPVKEVYDDLLNSTAYLEMLDTRKKLPAYTFKHKICSYLDTSQAVIVCGETGKSV